MQLSSDTWIQHAQLSSDTVIFQSGKLSSDASSRFGSRLQPFSMLSNFVLQDILSHVFSNREVQFSKCWYQFFIRISKLSHTLSSDSSPVEFRGASSQEKSVVSVRAFSLKINSSSQVCLDICTGPSL